MAKVGRPSGYKKSYCKDIIELAKQGHLPIIWSRELMVPKSTFHLWTNEHPEFMEAWQMAKDIAESYITELGRNGDALDLNKAKFFLSAAFNVSETVKKEIKQDVNSVITSQVSFADRDE